MSAKLKMLEHKMARQTARIEQPPDDDLSAAIQRLIDSRVEQALEQRPVKQPAHVQHLMDQFNRPEPVTDFAQLPAIPKTRAPKALEFQLQRDELGRVNMVNAGGMQWRVQRNELGEIVRMIPSDMAPMPPAVEPAALNRVPRKLYGNDPE